MPADPFEDIPIVAPPAVSDGSAVDPFEDIPIVASPDADPFGDIPIVAPTGPKLEGSAVIDYLTDDGYIEGTLNLPVPELPEGAVVAQDYAPGKYKSTDTGELFDLEHRRLVVDTRSAKGLPSPQKYAEVEGVVSEDRDRVQQYLAGAADQPTEPGFVNLPVFSDAQNRAREIRQTRPYKSVEVEDGIIDVEINPSTGEEWLALGEVAEVPRASMYSVDDRDRRQAQIDRTAGVQSARRDAVMRVAEKALESGVFPESQMAVGLPHMEMALRREGLLRVDPNDPEVYWAEFPSEDGSPSDPVQLSKAKVELVARSLLSNKLQEDREFTRTMLNKSKDPKRKAEVLYSFLKTYYPRAARSVSEGKGGEIFNDIEVDQGSPWFATIMGVGNALEIALPPLAASRKGLLELKNRTILERLAEGQYEVGELSAEATAFDDVETDIVNDYLATNKGHRMENGNYLLPMLGALFGGDAPGQWPEGLEAGEGGVPNLPEIEGRPYVVLSPKDFRATLLTDLQANVSLLGKLNPKRWMGMERGFTEVDPAEAWRRLGLRRFIGYGTGPDAREHLFGEHFPGFTETTKKGEYGEDVSVPFVEDLAKAISSIPGGIGTSITDTMAEESGKDIAAIGALPYRGVQDIYRIVDENVLDLMELIYPKGARPPDEDPGTAGPIPWLLGIPEIESRSGQIMAELLPGGDEGKTGFKYDPEIGVDPLGNVTFEMAGAFMDPYALPAAKGLMGAGHRVGSKAYIAEQMAKKGRVHSRVGLLTKEGGDALDSMIATRVQAAADELGVALSDISSAAKQKAQRQAVNEFAHAHAEANKAGQAIESISYQTELVAAADGAEKLVIKDLLIASEEGAVGMRADLNLARTDDLGVELIGGVWPSRTGARTQFQYKNAYRKQIREIVEAERAAGGARLYAVDTAAKVFSAVGKTKGVLVDVPLRTMNKVIGTDWKAAGGATPKEAWAIVRGSLTDLGYGRQEMAEFSNKILTRQAAQLREAHPDFDLSKYTVEDLILSMKLQEINGDIVLDERLMTEVVGPLREFLDGARSFSDEFLRMDGNFRLFLEDPRGREAIEELKFAQWQQKYREIAATHPPGSDQRVTAIKDSMLALEEDFAAIQYTLGRMERGREIRALEDAMVETLEQAALFEERAEKLEKQIPRRLGKRTRVPASATPQSAVDDLIDTATSARNEAAELQAEINRLSLDLAEEIPAGEQRLLSLRDAEVKKTLKKLGKKKINRLKAQLVKLEEKLDDYRAAYDDAIDIPSTFIPEKRGLEEAFSTRASWSQADIPVEGASRTIKGERAGEFVVSRNHTVTDDGTIVLKKDFALYHAPEAMHPEEHLRGASRLAHGFKSPRDAKSFGDVATGLLQTAEKEPGGYGLNLLHEVGVTGRVHYRDNKLFKPWEIQAGLGIQDAAAWSASAQKAIRDQRQLSRMRESIESKRREIGSLETALGQRINKPTERAARAWIDRTLKTPEGQRVLAEMKAAAKSPEMGEDYALVVAARANAWAAATGKNAEEFLSRLHVRSAVDEEEVFGRLLYEIDPSLKPVEIVGRTGDAVSEGGSGLPWQWAQATPKDLDDFADLVGGKYREDYVRKVAAAKRGKAAEGKAAEGKAAEGKAAEGKAAEGKEGSAFELTPEEKINYDLQRAAYRAARDASDEIERLGGIWKKSYKAADKARGAGSKLEKLSGVAAYNKGRPYNDQLKFVVRQVGDSKKLVLTRISDLGKNLDEILSKDWAELGLKRFRDPTTKTKAWREAEARFWRLEDVATEAWTKYSGAESELWRAAMNPESLKTTNGLIVFGEQEQALIFLFKSARAGTIGHEVGHFFRRDLPSELLARATKWATEVSGFGMVGKKWSIGMEEAWAEAFELYLKTGKAPAASGMADVFARFKSWIGELLTPLVKSGKLKKLDPEIRSIFDEVLGFNAPVRSSDDVARSNRGIKRDIAARERTMRKLNRVADSADRGAGRLRTKMQKEKTAIQSVARSELRSKMAAEARDLRAGARNSYYEHARRQRELRDLVAEIKADSVETAAALAVPRAIEEFNRAARISVEAKETFTAAEATRAIDELLMPEGTAPRSWKYQGVKKTLTKGQKRLPEERQAAILAADKGTFVTGHVRGKSLADAKQELARRGIVDAELEAGTRSKLTEKIDTLQEEIGTMLNPAGGGGALDVLEVLGLTEGATPYQIVKKVLDGQQEALSADVQLARAVPGYDKKMDTLLDHLEALTEEERFMVGDFLKFERLRGPERGGRYAGLTAEQEHLRPVIELFRGYYKEMLDLLQDQGMFKDWKLYEFLDRTNVSSYVPHTLAAAGFGLAGKARQLSRQAASNARIRGGGFLPTEAPPTMWRGMPGATHEVNAAMRWQVAEGLAKYQAQIHNPEVAKLLKAGRTVPDEMVEAVLRELPEELLAFEQNPLLVASNYSINVGKVIGNRRWWDDLQMVVETNFPEMTNLSQAIGDPKRKLMIRATDDAYADLKAEAIRLDQPIPPRESGVVYSRALANLDQEARKEGMRLYGEPFERLGGADYMSLVTGGKFPSGDSAVLDAINLMVTRGDDVADVQEQLLHKFGLEISVAEAKSFTRGQVYLPAALRDFVRAQLGHSDLATTLRNIESPHIKGAGQLFLDTSDNVNEIFKGMVTVVWPRFHGRNAWGGMIANAMIHGAKGVEPELQKKFVMMLSREGADIPFTWGKHTYTGSEWQDIMRRTHVTPDRGGVADIEATISGAERAGLGPTEIERMRAAADRVIKKFSEGGESRLEVWDEIVDYLYDAATMKEGREAWHAEKHTLPSTGLVHELTGGKMGQKAQWGRLKTGPAGKAVTGTLGGLGVGLSAGITSGSAGVTGLSGLVGATVGFMSTMPARKLVALGGEIGLLTETQLRGTNFVAGLEMGHSIEEAAWLATHTHFNYNPHGQSWFSYNVLRRMFPFWTWNSKNFKKQLWLMRHRPQEYAALQHIITTGTHYESSPELEATLPPSFSSRIALHMREGAWHGFGTPFEAFVEALRPQQEGGLPGTAGLGGLLHPMALWGYEELSDRSLYFDKPLEEIRSARDLQYLGWAPFLQEYFGAGPSPENPEIWKLGVLEADYHPDKPWIPKSIKEATTRWNRVRKLNSLGALMSMWQQVRAEAYQDAYGELDPAGMKVTIPERIARVGLSWRRYHYDSNEASVKHKAWRRMIGRLKESAETDDPQGWDFYGGMNKEGYDRFATEESDELLRELLLQSDQPELQP